MWTTKVKDRSCIGLPNAPHTLLLLWVFERISIMLYDYFIVWIRPSVDIKTNPWRYGTILTLSACYSVMTLVMIIYAWLWWFVSTFQNYNQILQNVCFTYIYALIYDASLVLWAQYPGNQCLVLWAPYPGNQCLVLWAPYPGNQCL